MILFLLFLSAFVGAYFTMQTTLQLVAAIAQKRGASLTVNLVMAALGIAGTVTSIVYAIKVGI
jgi:preprotein translocase subunit YajC